MNLNTEAKIRPMSMAERLDAQHELETLSMEMGIERYRASLQKEGTGSLPPGQQLIKAAMEPMEGALKAWLERTREGLAARSAGVFYFIDQLEPAAVAWLTAKAAIGFLHERPSVTKVSVALALQMESALNVDAICKANPRLGAKVAKQAANKGAGRNAAVFIRKGAQLADVKVIQWDDGVRLRVGTLLLQMFAESTGLVALETCSIGGGKTSTLLRPTEACRQWLEGAHARCALLSPVRMPMVSPPRDWTNPFNGGYLSPKLRQPLVKTRNRGYLTELKEWDMPWVYAAVNTLQATEWAVNQPLYEVVKTLWEAGSDLGGIPMRKLGSEVILPAKPWPEGTEPSPEQLHAWKVEAARAYEADAKAESKRLQLVNKLWVAEEMMQRGNRFHYVYNMDWRGRLYPVAASLSPQGDDVSKALLSFAQGSRLREDGAYWLAIHTANSFGVDKVSFEERIEWVEEHTEAIIECGRDPLAYRWWAEADSPFVFLAACIEYAKLDAWVQAGGAQEDFVSHIPVAFDGACNGLQNFSAMLRDPVGGAATGLVPGEKPADIYSEVARAAQALIDQEAREGSEVALRWVGKMTRKLAKRNTMTVPYGVTRRGMRDQLFGELTDSAPEHRAEDASYLAQKNFEAIGSVVVAARQAMDWLREAAKVAAENQLPVRWTTPAGFLAVQDYRQEEGQWMDFTVMGRRFKLLLQRTGDRLNGRKQSLGISPNFVHSLDAAHLMRTVLFCAQDGMEHFAMIHDSFGCHAGHASTLRNNLRAAFVEQYSAPVLEKFRDELAEQLPEELRAKLPELPPMGTLDLSLVEQSEYFFA
jgi:DNA-directed RNA polymerase